MIGPVKGQKDLKLLLEAIHLKLFQVVWNKFNNYKKHVQ